jgi:hypothetical protein
MSDRYRTPGGWTVEVVQLSAGDRLRIRHHGFYVADVLSVDDLARWIPSAELAQLERDTLILRSWPRHTTSGLPGRAQPVVLHRLARCPGPRGRVRCRSGRPS